MGNQLYSDYTQFLQIPRSFVKIRGDSFCMTSGEQNTLSPKQKFMANSIVSVVKLWQIATLYINVGNTENRAVIN